MAPAAEVPPDRVEAWRRERREAARRWHPDRGGSDAELMAALAAVDARHTVAPPPPAAGADEDGAPVVVADLGSVPHRVLLWWRQAWGRVRRRYIEI